MNTHDLPSPPIDREDEPRILSVRGLSWPVSVSITLPHAKGIVSCVVPRHIERCPCCGRPQEVA